MDRASELDGQTAIAITGMACRFPGAPDIARYWRNLRDGVESIRHFTDDELADAGVPAEAIADPDYVKASPVLDGINLFDAGFFGFTPTEARICDPQQRLFLEVAWTALESANCDPSRFDGSVGVFAGSAISTYLLNNLMSNEDITTMASPMQLALGNDKDSLCTRVGYAFDLRGPCYGVHSYCSSSLVAVSAACTSLVAGDCDLALAGGVSVSVPHNVGYDYQQGGITSADGHCRAFDAESSGAPLGNGVGAVVLKRLADAIADGDRVHAVIRGWAVNNDGGHKAGYTTPGVRGQAEVISEALANADVDGGNIDYLEAHGTGTALGDAAEFTALRRAFGGSAEPGGCVLGSVKTNVGHLDRAAGVAGLIKTVLALTHRQLPPTLHFRTPNPDIDLANSPFRIQTTLTDWPRRADRCRAGVSAFGIGGTNAHVVLEEAPEPPPTTATPRTPALLVLSARTEEALDARVADLADALADSADELADVAYTLQVGRKEFEHRRALVALDRADAVRALREPGSPRLLIGAEPVPGREVVFVLTGVADSAITAFAAELYEAEPLFRSAVDECAASAPEEIAAEVRAAVLGQAVPGDAATLLIERALARMLLALGIRPVDSLVQDRSGAFRLEELLAEPGRMVVHIGAGPHVADLDQAEQVVRIPRREPGGVMESMLTTIARLWLAGVHVDWPARRADGPRRLVSLPTYPFQRQSYWIDPPAMGAAPGELRWYVPRWEQAEPIEPAPAIGPFLLFAETDYSSLAAHGPCVRVASGEYFAELADDTFVLRPGEPTDYDRLFARLAELNRLPSTVVHAWGITGPDADPADPETVLRHRIRGFDSIACLARSLSARVTSGLDITVLADHLYDVDGTTTVSPGKAAVLGACLVIPQEYPGFTCRAVDVTGDTSVTDEVLLRELAAPAGQRAVAWRDGRRLEQSYVPAVPAVERPGAVLRDDGVYLVTGGLGNVGLLIAEHIAATVRRPRLVLVGRRALPPREQWQTSRDERMRRLLAVEALGAELTVCTANELAAALAGVGAIDAVVHAAGLTGTEGFQPIQALSTELVDRHFAAKVDSLLGVRLAVANRPVGRHVLFSSMSTVLGGLGFAAYASANAVLDAYAQFLTRSGERCTSVDWDTWRGTAERLGGAGVGKSMTEFSMTVDDGLDALRRLLAADEPRVIVSAGELASRLEEWVAGDDHRPTTAPVDQSPPSVGNYERRLTELWRETLGVERVGLDDNFFDLGGNSLMGLQLLKRIGREFGTNVPAVALFQAPTVSAIARYLTQRNAIDDGQRSEARSARATQEHRGDIAVIGMAGRFPGAADIDEYWRNLRDGVESIRFFTDEELLAAGVPAEQLTRPNYVKARPVLDGVPDFDAGFFGYSPKEATLTDPQHRLFLESCWHALENAGYAEPDYRGQVGVFAGTNISTYLRRLHEAGELDNGISDYQVVIGNDKDSLTTTVSYKLDLTGPSMAVQTFCSTSLLAVHLAAQSLRSGECDIALAGGVSIRVPDRVGHLYNEGGMESPDGHVRTFDAAAHGSMFGDGVGVVVLKPLAEALEDGDLVHVVIKGSAVNNDGSLKVGFTAPSVAGQAQVVASALAAAGVDPETVSYVEAHGTATEMGDPIEVTALTKAFGDTRQKQYCAIGSVKTNVGHLDRAAGVSGLIKVVLALRHRQIPPSLHYTEPNPEIDFANSPFYVNAALGEWNPPPGQPRRAGINSLGMGGTNVHMIVEEAPSPEATSPGRAEQLLVLSARTPAALDQAAEGLARHLRENGEADLADVAYTLQVGRGRFEHRRLVRCGSIGEAVRALDGDDPARVLTRHEPRTDRPAALLFAGVGEQYPGMAADLDETEPAFRAAIDECRDVLDPLLGVDLREVLFCGRPAVETDLRAMLGRGAATRPSAADDLITRTAIAQPAVFAVEYATARLLLSWGLRPDAMAGYSVGEYVAATLAGVLTLPDALRLLAHRARLIDTLPKGAMLAVSTSAEEIRPLLADVDDRLDIVAVNAAGQCVLAGPPRAVERMVEALAQRDVAHRRLDAEHAFHSRMLDPIADDLTSWVRENVNLAAPKLPYVSNVTGTWITAEQATDPGYWARHMCGTVRFADAIGALLGEPDRLLVEIGPGQSLGAFARQHPDCGPQRMALIIPTLPARHERSTACETMHAAQGKLWLTGAAVDWTSYHAGESRRRVPLPGYPFQRERYWADAATPKVSPPSAPDVVDLTGNPREVLVSLPRKELDDWYYLPSWHQASAPHCPAPTVEGPWLIFADAHGVAHAAVERIVAAGGKAVLVTTGTGFTTEDGAAVVRVGAPEDYAKLVDLVRPRYVLHLWSLDEPPGHVVEAAEWTMERGYFSLLWLAKALGRSGAGACDLIVASAGACNVTGVDEVVPERATVAGPCKVIPLELSTVTCRQVDVRVPITTAHADRVAGQLIGEVAADPAQILVGWRGARRWVSGFEPLARASGNGAEVLRERGVYLITGGLGGIGLAIARGLARTVSARLVLLGRTQSPPRAQWSELLADPATPVEVRRRIEAIRDLEAMGAEVLVGAADVTDAATLRQVITAAVEKFGAVNGIVHTAGVPGMGLLQFKDHENAAVALRPKVTGTRVLLDCVAGLEMDFIALFSSITAVTGGGPGQVDYCAANAYLDAVAQRACLRDSTRVISINWAEWRWNAWGAGLSGYAPEVQQFFADNRDRVGITFEEGWRAFLGAIGSSEPQVIVSPQDFRVLAELSRTFTIETVLSLGLETRGTHARPELGTSYVAPSTELERRIAAIWSDALGIIEIGLHDNFFELGGNSLVGVDLIARVRREFERDALAPHVLYLAPTVGALAQLVGDHGAEQVQVADMRARGALRRQGLRTRRNQS